MHNVRPYVYSRPWFNVLNHLRYGGGEIGERHGLLIQVLSSMSFERVDVCRVHYEVDYSIFVR